MTDYSGTFTGSRVEYLGPTPIYPHGSSITWAYDLAFRLVDAKVDAAGIVTGTFSASGTVTKTYAITGPPNPASPPSVSVQPFALAPTSLSTARDAFSVSTIAAALAVAPPPGVPRGALDALHWAGGSASWGGSWNDGSPSLFAFNFNVGLSRTSPFYTFETVWIPTPTPQYPNAVAENPTEGDSGTTLFSYDIVRDIGIDRSTTVAWAVQPYGADAASAADFAGGVLPSGTATFAPGQSRIRITVPVAGDTDIEVPETFMLVQPDVANDPFPNPLSHHATAIGNDDVAPSLSLAGVALDVAEGDTPGNQIVFRIERSGQLVHPSTVDWWLSGTGPRPLRNEDLAAQSPSSGRIVIPSGAASATVTLTLAGGTAGNQDRDFTVTAVPATGPLAGSQIGVLQGSVHDDDDAPGAAELTLLAAATGQPRPAAPGWYNGAVLDLEKELILLGSEGVVLVASTPNWFLRTGSGNDAIAAGSGVNVIDGGSGSNFLSGQGRENYFVDARGLTAPVWSTIVGRDAFDTVSVWIDKGVQPTIFWEENQGAEGYRGLTMHVIQPGRPLASLTMPGFTLADTLPVRVGITSFGPRVFTFQGTSSDGEMYIGVNANP